MALNSTIFDRPANNPILGTMGSSPPISPSANNSYGSPGLFNAAVQTQGGDYDKIMGDYDSLVQSGGGSSPRLQYTPIAPNSRTYQPSSGLQSAMAQFQNIASTGGLSEGDVGNIRARAVSPIRSIYANAQRNLAHQKNLQGGYSPNYGAASSKMARELSEQIGQANTNVEGSIAEMQQRGKLAALPGIANLASEEAQNQNIFNQNEQNRIDQINQMNATIPLEYGRYNAGIDNQNFGNRLQAIEGKRGLYGTTPALINTFGDQVAQANQQKLQQQQLKQQQDQTGIGLAGDIFGRRVG